MKSTKHKSEAQQRKIHAFRMETRKQHTPQGGVPWSDHGATHNMPFECRKAARQLNISGQGFMVNHFAQQEQMRSA